MANNFESNITRQLAKVFIKGFDSERVLSKNVNTQLLSGRFNSSSGENVDFKRPTDFVTKRTSTGDISGTTATSIITGKATGKVQDYFTEEVDWMEADEAIKMDQMEELLNPVYKRMITDLELDFAGYMLKNTGLIAGTFGTPVSTWDHVARWGATMQAAGIPMDGEWTSVVNPFTQTSLASAQKSLGAGGSAGSLVSEAYRKATVNENYAGMRVMTGTTLASFTSGTGADRAGTLAASPDVTYVGAKDTMTQSLSLAGFQASMVVKAGDVIRVSGRNRLNLSTRKAIIDETGANVLHSWTVTADVTLDGSGAGVVVGSGAAIYESGGAYNTVDSAPVSGDVVTILSATAKLYQPNLFWHKQAFSIGSVPLKKLYSTDTLAKTADGLQIRVSKGASIRENKQIIRFDLRPAYATLNPFFAGQGWGS